MAAFKHKNPDKPFNCFDAAFWAGRNGITAALGGDARWALLTTMYTHLPNVRVGTRRLAVESGLSLPTVKKARRSLREVGLISYVDSFGGDRKETTTAFSMTNVYHEDIAKALCRRISGDVPVPAPAPVWSAGDDPDAFNENDVEYMDDGIADEPA